MTSIIRWDPYKELQTVQDRMNRVFSDVWGRSARTDEDYISGSWFPSVDVRESADALEIMVEVPGVEPKDVTLSVEGGVLTLKGNRQFQTAREGENYHRVERAYGAFERSFTLPTNVDTSGIKATYKLGVLHLHLPKREEAKPRSIAIKVEEK
jgi:HSP20 family protein